MNAATPVLAVRGLSISLERRQNGLRPLFRDLDFTVGRGEVLAIIGQSGSGKTTLARAVVGLPPSHVAEATGEIFLAGKRLDTLDRRELRKMRQRDVSLIFQDPATALNPTMTIGRQLFPPDVRGMDTGAWQSEGHRLLRDLQLTDPDTCLSAYPFELSGGMKQRILIASSLLATSSLVVADEPTSALDPVLRNQVLELFLKLASGRGIGVLLITHDLPLVSRYANRILVLNEGRLTEPGGLEMVRPKRPQCRMREATVPAIGDEIHPASILSVRGLCVDVPVRRRWFRRPGQRRRILDDVHMEIRHGEIVGVLGASGVGKSTLGRCVLGLVTPSAGTITIDQGNRRSSGTEVQIIYQNPYSSLSPKMTVRSIVLEPLRSDGALGAREQDEKYTAIMADVGMGPEFSQRRPHELSGGQRQRVAVARALISNPKLVVADEPVSSLDASARDQVLELICRLRDRYGFACLFISHDLGVLCSIADRIAVMDEGRIVEVDTPDRLLQFPSHPCTAGFVAASLSPTQVLRTCGDTRTAAIDPASGLSPS